MIIDTIKGKYSLQNESSRDISLMPEGIVKAYCNEVSDQFLIIKLRSNIEIKVSESELSECTRNYYFSDNISSSDLLKYIREFLNRKFVLTGNREIRYLINPLTFLKWFMYVIKDVF